MRIVDLHNDCLTKLDGSDLKKYLLASKKSGVKFLSCSFFSSNTQKSKCFKLLKEKADFLRSLKLKNFCLHIEDIYFADTKKKLDDLLEYAPFSCSLTWNSNNAFAGGAKDDGCLTPLGEYAINLFNKNGVLLDYAHLNKKSFWEICKISKQPIYVSHTGFYFDNDCERNLDDKQIKKVIETNGFMGVYMLKRNIIGNKEKFDSFAYAKTIFDFVSIYGDKNIGLGTDFWGLSEYPKDIKDYKDLKNLKIELKNLGLKKSSIDNIFYKNFFNFLKRTKKQG